VMVTVRSIIVTVVDMSYVSLMEVCSLLYKVIKESASDVDLKIAKMSSINLTKNRGLLGVYID
jgi:hypothetical protein